MKPLIPLEDRDYSIYLITNLVNGKRYVGQTCKTLERRWDLHCWNADHTTGGYFASAIKKYGPESFLVEKLCTAKGRKEADHLERFFIQWYETIDRTKGYNCTTGGDGGFVFSDESRQKLSASQKALGRKMTQEQKDFLRNINLGSKRSPETGKKLSLRFRKAPTKEVHRLYLDEGLNTYEVAEKLGLKQSVVWNLLDFDGIPKRPNKGDTLPQYRKDLAKNKELARLYSEEKLSTTKLAKIFETSTGTILRHLRDQGVPIRGRAESASETRTQNFDTSKLNIKNFSVVNKEYVMLGGKKNWLCRCICGYEQYYPTNQLTQGKVSDCKWHQKHPIPLPCLDVQTVR